MEIKKVRKGDAAIINDILANHIDSSNKRDELPTKEHLEKLLEDDRCYLFAAIIEDTVVGYALVYRFPSLYASENLAYLYDIEVSQDHRRKGIGRGLVETLISHLKDDDVKELWLGTGVDNIEGQSLFSATGAIKTEETFNDYTYYLTDNK